jgi:hypothetical protein
VLPAPCKPFANSWCSYMEINYIFFNIPTLIQLVHFIQLRNKVYSAHFYFKCHAETFHKSWNGKSSKKMQNLMKHLSTWNLFKERVHLFHSNCTHQWISGTWTKYRDLQIWIQLDTPWKDKNNNRFILKCFSFFRLCIQFYIFLIILNDFCNQQFLNIVEI